MRVNEIPTSDFFSDDTRAEDNSHDVSSPTTPRRCGLPDFPPFSPTCSHLGIMSDSGNCDELVELLEEDDVKDALNLSEVEEDTAASPPPEQDPILLEKQAWVKRMRLMFCVREDLEITKNIIHEDGTLNQEYFRPPKGIKLMGEEGKKWTEKERGLLVKGIETYGIGHFREISEALLPDWQPNDLRVKSMRLVGRQNLQEYKDWRGDEEAIKAEFERNKDIGTRLGCWKSGVLVYDDDGKVDAEIKANPVKRGADIKGGLERSDKKRRRV